MPALLHLGWLAIALAFIGWTLIALGTGWFVGKLIDTADHMWDEAKRR